MSRKSLTSLLKLRILDSGLALVDRKKSLRDLPHPSRRFLQRLIENADIPPELRRAASRMLVNLLSAPKAKPIESSSPLASEPQEEVESPKVIDPEIWDLVGGVPGCVRGPETAPAKVNEPVELRKPVR